MLTQSDLRHAQIIVEQGFASQDEVARCMTEIKDKRLPTTLVDLMLDKGFLTGVQVGSVTAAASAGNTGNDDRSLGQKAVSMGFISQPQVDECLAQIAAAGDANPPRLGQLLLSKGFITEFQFQKLVAASGAPPAAGGTRVAAQGAVPSTTGPTRIATPRPAPSPVGPAGKPTPRPAPSPVGPAGKPTPRPSPSPVAPSRTPTPRPGPAMPAGIPRPAALDTSRCSFCGIEIKIGQATHWCPSCKSAYHQWCWVKTEGCVQSECQLAQGLEDRVKSRSMKGLLAALGPLTVRIGMAAAVIGVCLFLYRTFSHDAQYYYDLGKAAVARSNSAASSEDKGGSLHAYDIHKGMLMAESSGTNPVNVEKTTNLEDAIVNFREAVKKKPDFVNAWFEMGLAFLALNRPKDAYEALQKVMELEPKHGEAMVTMGAACEGLGDFSGAEKWYKESLAAAPDLIQAHQLLGLLYDNKLPNAKDKAAAEYRLVLDKKPEDADMAARLTKILIDQGNIEEAMQILSRSEKLDPMSTVIQQRLALLYYKKGNWDKALSYAQKAVAAEPRDWPTKTVQALCLDKLGKFDQAYAVAKDVLTGWTDAEILGLAGKLAIRAGEPDRGIMFLQQALATKHSPEMLEQIGDALMAMDRAEMAKDAYEKLWSINPDYPRITFKMGLAFCSTKDRAVAAGKVNNLLSSDPKNPDLRALSAMLVRDGGDPSGALERLNGILAEGAKSSFVHLQIGITQRTLGNLPAALAAYRSSLAVDGCPDALYELGMTYATLKNDAASKDFLGRYMQAVSFGTKYNTARDKLGGAIPAGGMPTTDLSFAESATREGVRQLGAGTFTNPEAYDRMTASVCGMAATLGLVIGDPSLAQGEASALQAAISQLQTDPNTRRYQDPAGGNSAREAELLSAVERWSGEMMMATQAVIAWAKAHDKDGKLSAEIKAATQLTGGSNGYGGTPGLRIETASKAFTGAIHLLLMAVADSKGTRDAAERIEVERGMQLEVCKNNLQNVCAESYATVKLASLIVQGRDARGAHRSETSDILKRFEQREAQAKSVTEQLANAGTAVTELLWLVASDPSLKP